MNRLLGMTVILGLAAAPAFAQSSQEECKIEDLEDYYGEELDEDYDLRGRAEEIARALYTGPLMREPDPAGLRNIQQRLSEGDMEIETLQGIVRGHLYGESEEFEKELKRLRQRHGREEAAERVLDSIYDAFEYRPTPGEEELDTCLIRQGEAHLVVTKAILNRLET